MKIPEELKSLVNYLSREEEHLQLSPTESRERIIKMSALHHGMFWILKVDMGSGLKWMSSQK